MLHQFAQTNVHTAAGGHAPVFRVYFLRFSAIPFTIVVLVLLSFLFFGCDGCVGSWHLSNEMASAKRIRTVDRIVAR